MENINTNLNGERITPNNRKNRKRGGRSEAAKIRRLARGKESKIQERHNELADSMFSIHGKFFKDNSECFHNLGNFNLSNDEKVVLSLGGKFICKILEKPKLIYSHTKELVKDVHLFIRRMSIKNLFGFADSDSPTNVLYVPNPSFKPPVYTALERYKLNLLAKVQIISEYHKKNYTHTYKNSHQCLTRGIRSLLKRKDLVIKPSDKNLGLALMKSDYYINACLSHLDNPLHYKVITTPLKIDLLFDYLHTILSDFHEFLKLHPAHMKYIHQDLNNLKARNCNYYILPKVHKTGTRPICDNTNFYLYWTSRYIHICLLPYLQHYSSKKIALYYKILHNYLIVYMTLICVLHLLYSVLILPLYIQIFL